LALRRGFKAESERRAEALWRDLQLEEGDRIEAIALATHLGYFVRCADELIDRQKLKKLEKIQPGAFSACTFRLPNRVDAIVYSPFAHPTRRNSDVAHEIAHLLLGHRLSRLERVGDVAFLSCDAVQEEEARWLSGCLLLPRFALLHDLKQRLSHRTIAETRILSEEMVRYRVNVTGVLRQLQTPRRPGT
jgi:Zn-dependent peptidase ImmA (M78 family)